jgi:hypothetical protein
MLSKKKWFIAFVLVLLFSGLTKLEKNQILTTTYAETLVAPQQPNEIVKRVVAFFGKSNETITVSAPVATPPLIEYKSIQPYDGGAMLSINQSQDLYASADGLIIYTGYTRQTGKTLTILYDTGETATFGFVEEFHQLPYTTISSGDIFASAESELLYIKVKKDGEEFEMSEIVNWLTVSDE